MNALTALYQAPIHVNDPHGDHEFFREDTLRKLTTSETLSTALVASYDDGSIGILFRDGERVFIQCETEDPISWFDCYESSPTYTRRRFYMNLSSVRGLLSILHGLMDPSDAVRTVVMTGRER